MNKMNADWKGKLVNSLCNFSFTPHPREPLNICSLTRGSLLRSDPSPAVPLAALPLTPRESRGAPRDPAGEGPRADL